MEYVLRVLHRIEERERGGDWVEKISSVGSNVVVSE